MCIRENFEIATVLYLRDTRRVRPRDTTRFRGLNQVCHRPHPSFCVHPTQFPCSSTVLWLLLALSLPSPSPAAMQGPIASIRTSRSSEISAPGTTAMRLPSSYRPTHIARYACGADGISCDDEGLPSTANDCTWSLPSISLVQWPAVT